MMPLYNYIYIFLTEYFPSLRANNKTFSLTRKKLVLKIIIPFNKTPLRAVIYRQVDLIFIVIASHHVYGSFDYPSLRILVNPDILRKKKNK